MPIKTCVFSSGRHIYDILSVGVPFLGVKHVKPAMMLLIDIAKFLFAIGNMLPAPHPILLLCPNQGHILVGIGWKLCSNACVLPYSLVSISHSC